MSRVTFIIFISGLIFSSYGSILYVEIPEWIDLRKLWEKDSAVMKEVEKIVDSLIKEKIRRGVPEEIDFIIKYTRNGELIIPDTMEYKKEGWHILSGPSGNLTPKRGSGWTDTEWQEVLSHWNKAYLKIKEVYGYPFRTVNVKITKDPNLNAAGVFYPSCWGGESNIKIRNWGSDYWRGVLTHEMIHAFRDDWICAYDQFEEGMTEAMEVEVQNRIYESWETEERYPNLYHRDDFLDYAEYSMHEFWNEDFIGTYYSDFTETSGFGSYLPLWRYKTAGYAWWKVFKDDPNFMIKFNEDLWNSSWWWPPSRKYGFYKELAFDNFNGGLIENKTFSEWWNGNPILNINFDAGWSFPYGVDIGVIPTPHMGVVKVYVIWRHYDEAGRYREDLVSNLDIKIKVWNWKGEKIYEEVKKTSQNGYVGFSYPSFEEARYKIEVYPKDYADPQNFPWLYKKRVILEGNNIEDKNFVGAVGAEPNTVVWIGDYYFYASKGIFKQPPPLYSGERKIYYISKFLGEMKDYVIKDLRYYHVYPGSNLKVPPAQPQNLNGNISGNQVYLTWNQNYELDIKGYNIYRKINYEDYQKINPSIVTSTNYTTSLPSAQFIIYRVTGVDINNHEGYFSDPYVVKGPLLSGYPIAEDKVKLIWEYPEDPDNFILQWKIEGGEWISITLTRNIREYVHSNLSWGKKYYYRIKAKYEFTESPFSSEIIVYLNYLTPPTNLSTNSSYPYNSVTLTWCDNSNYESGYEIWRKGINENWHSIFTYPTQGQGTGQIQWSDNSVSRFRDYFYKVRAYRDGIYSEFSNERWVTTSPIIALGDVNSINLCSSSNKNIIRIGNIIHTVYSKDLGIYHAYSIDNGLTWNQEVIGSGISPTLTSHNDTLWVAYERVVDGNPKYVKFGKRLEENYWEFTSLQIEGFDPSILYVKNKGVYIAFIEKKIIPPPLLFKSLQNK